MDKKTMKPTEPKNFKDQVPTSQDLEALTKADPWLEAPAKIMKSLYELWDKDEETSHWQETETKKKISFKVKTAGSTRNFLLIEALKHNQYGFWNLFWKKSKTDGRYLIVVPKKKISEKVPRPKFSMGPTPSTPNNIPEEAYTTFNLMREISIMDLEREHYKELCTKLKTQLAEKGIVDYWKSKADIKQDTIQNGGQKLKPQRTLLGGVDIEPQTIEGLDKLGEVVGHS